MLAANTFSRHFRVSTHSRPKAAEELQDELERKDKVSTHSRPKAAVPRYRLGKPSILCFNTQPPEGGCPPIALGALEQLLFQHTAARRRLAYPDEEADADEMFQHTAARRRLAPALILTTPSVCFNTQPPEGGWLSSGLF